jgi:secreted trypsin-like serine protease
MASSFGTVHHVRPSPRVILGQIVDPLTAPFYCTLYIDYDDDAGTAICGGVLLGGGEALTAAHCVFRGDTSDPAYYQRPSAVYARLYGRLRPISERLVRVDIESIRVHPRFDLNSMKNDIAWLQIPDTESLNQTVNITLNRSRRAWNDLSSWDRLDVIGVGHDANEALSLGAPREVYLSRRTCSNPVGYGDLLAVPKEWYHTDICAGPFEPCAANQRCADACRGDSGGPLFGRNDDGSIIVYGLVSRGGEKCGIHGLLGGSPGIYAPMDAHGDFLRNVANSTPYVRATRATNGARRLTGLPHYALIYITYILAHR